MARNVGSHLSKGLRPEQFVAGMTRNQDTFQNWYDQFQWKDQADADFFASYGNSAQIRCAIIAADWCGDVVRNVPVVFRLMEQAGIPTEVLIMEENLVLIDQFLTMGGRSIPIVLFVNGEGDVLGQWGPRPAYIQEPMVRFKQANTDKSAPDYDDSLKAARAEIMARYGEGTGYQALIVKELRQLLASLSSLFPAHLD